MNKKTYPPELIAAIEKATSIYNKNTENLAAYARELDNISGYLQAKEDVKRLYALYLEQKENE